MENATLGTCRKLSCANPIPKGLVAEQLCLKHFLDEAFLRTEQALEKCHQGQRIDTKGVEGLLADSLAIVNNLDEEEPAETNAGQRDRMLELLLLLANVHEHVAQQSHPSARPMRLA